MSDSKTLGASMPSILTRAELRQRLAQRAKPLAEPHLTIDGAPETEIHTTLNRLSEGRIERLREGLSGARDRLQANHRLTALRGRTKQDFERGR